MLEQRYRNTIVKGLKQFNNEALARIRDHEGEMLLTGNLVEDGLG